MNRQDMIECIKDNVVKEYDVVPNTFFRETIIDEGKQMPVGDGLTWHVYMEYPTKKEYLYDGYTIFEKNGIERIQTKQATWDNLTANPDDNYLTVMAYGNGNIAAVTQSYNASTIGLNKTREIYFSFYFWYNIKR